MRSVLFVVLGMTCAGLGALAACSSDNNPTPTITSTPDSGSPPPPDGGTGTIPGCASDAATCNSCVSAESDPYNACSPLTGGCVPFDNGRVPKDVNGGIPQVP